MEGENAESFEAVWSGIVHFSYYLNRDVADIVAPIYLKAVKHIGWLSDEVRNGFIDLYLLLLIYVVDDPCLEYIPNFYDVADENARCQFLSNIQRRLRKMESGQKKILWSDWLKEYICNRYDNKPVLMLEKEKSLILNWIFELKEVYGEMVEIVCKAKMPSNLGTLFLYRLDESKIVLEHPHETIKLLTKILNDGSELNCSGEEINNICKEAVGLTDEENKNLHEALLKRNIKLE